jgi:hypothetical protein
MDLLQGRTLVPDAAQVVTSGATKVAFIADVVRLHAERASQLSAIGDLTATTPKAFQTMPRADRVWNETAPSAAKDEATANDAPMCVEMAEPAVCE